MKPQLVQKTNPASETLKRTAARDAVVDEYAPLAIEVQALGARLRVMTAEASRYSLLKEEIRAWAEPLKPEGKFIYETDRNLIEISAKENEGQPDKKLLFQHLGATRFLKACTITQKASKEQLQARI